MKLEDYLKRDAELYPNKTAIVHDNKSLTFSELWQQTLTAAESLPKGEKVVYLGYETTDNDKEAITDLAVMHMKGDYDTVEYDGLFSSYIEGQIKPMIARLTDAIAEYRVNFGSDNESNRQRAEYVRRALNMFIDDDTGKGMGDLLLNTLKTEDEAA